MTRFEFFKWLSNCPSNKVFIQYDDYGVTTVRFEYEEEEDFKNNYVH